VEPVRAVPINITVVGAPAAGFLDLVLDVNGYFQ
jgi:hypothetical protein